MKFKRAKTLAMLMAVVSVLFFAAPSFARTPARPAPGGFGQTHARAYSGHYYGPRRHIGPYYRPYARPYARPYYRPYARPYARPYYRPYARPYYRPYYYSPYPRPYAWWYPQYPSFFVPGFSFYFSF